eukprot:8590716-Alexandrium_andersonii.AAC.1
MPWPALHQASSRAQPGPSMGRAMFQYTSCARRAQRECRAHATQVHLSARWLDQEMTPSQRHALLS